MILLVAAGLAACSVGLWRGPSPDRVVRVRLMAERPAGRSQRLPKALVVAGAVAGGAVLVVDEPGTVVAAAVAVFCGWAAVTLRTRSRRRAHRSSTRAELIDACEALGAELEAGIPPSAALGHVAAEWDVLSQAGVAASLGGDVPEALRQVADAHDVADAADLAAAWEVSERTGARLVVVLSRLTSSMRDEQEARREVEASLGAPRATARLMAVLPLLGLGLGSGLGGSPWRILTSTTVGLVCLVVGSALAVAGVFWVEHVTDRAEP